MLFDEGLVAQERVRPDYTALFVKRRISRSVYVGLVEQYLLLMAEGRANRMPDQEIVEIGKRGKTGEVVHKRPYQHRGGYAVLDVDRPIRPLATSPPFRVERHIAGRPVERTRTNASPSDAVFRLPAVEVVDLSDYMIVSGIHMVGRRDELATQP